jgi:hypothetical protein
MKAIATTIKDQVKPAQGRPWEDRIVLGVWATKYIVFCDQYLAGFPISFIGFSLTYASQFFRVDNVSFNMVQWCLMGLGGKSFIRKAKKLDRQVFAWTVNLEKDMRWCIQNQLDGVISDDPKKFLETCTQWEAQPEPVTWTMGELYTLLKYQLLLTVYFFIFRWRMGSGIDQKFVNTPDKKTK